MIYFAKEFQFYTDSNVDKVITYIDIDCGAGIFAEIKSYKTLFSAS